MLNTVQMMNDVGVYCLTVDGTKRSVIQGEQAVDTGVHV